MAQSSDGGGLPTLGCRTLIRPPLPAASWHHRYLSLIRMPAPSRPLPDQPTVNPPLTLCPVAR